MSDEIYRLESVPLFEAMYGPGLISFGGYEAIDDRLRALGAQIERVEDEGRRKARG